MPSESREREVVVVRDGAAEADLWLRIVVSIGLILWGLLLAVQSASGNSSDGHGGDVASQLVGRSLPTLDGKSATVVLGENATVVHFWATWCAPCKRELPLLDTVAARYEKAGVRFCAVSVDKDLASVRRFVDRLGLGLPIFVDGPDGLARALDLPSLPYTIVLDGEGHTVLETSGGSEAQIMAIETAIALARRDAEDEAAEAAALPPIGGSR